MTAITGGAIARGDLTRTITRLRDAVFGTPRVSKRSIRDMGASATVECRGYFYAH